MTPFGTAATGETVHAITISGGALTATVLTWGAILQDLRHARLDRSLTLGSDRLSDYEGDMVHHGALIGPVANRISTGRVRIGGMMYELERNQDGRIHLHSGSQATHRRLWQVEDHGPSHVTLSCALPDGICGLPGNRRITATWRVQDETLALDITGTTDATTLMNCANHSFWNMDGTPTWDGHTLWIAADHYLPTDADVCPTGEIAPVDGTAMDFRTARRIDPARDAFDHNFCLSRAPSPLRDVLKLTGTSGVAMTVATDQSGLQLFDNRKAARPGRQFYEGLAIEAQAWPDAPNHPGFPDITVTPGAPYRQQTEFRFDVP